MAYNTLADNNNSFKILSAKMSQVTRVWHKIVSNTTNITAQDVKLGTFSIMLIKLTYKNVPFVNWKTVWIAKITFSAENVTMVIFWMSQIIMKNASNVLKVARLV